MRFRLMDTFHDYLISTGHVSASTLIRSFVGCEIQCGADDEQNRIYIPRRSPNEGNRPPVEHDRGQQVQEQIRTKD